MVRRDHYAAVTFGNARPVDTPVHPFSEAVAFDGKLSVEKRHANCGVQGENPVVGSEYDLGCVLRSAVTKVLGLAPRAPVIVALDRYP